MKGFKARHFTPINIKSQIFCHLSSLPLNCPGLTSKSSYFGNSSGKKEKITACWVTLLDFFVVAD